MSRSRRYTERGAGYHLISAGTAQVAACARSGGRKLSRAEGSCWPVAVAYRLRECGLPECGRVLEPADRDLHDFGERLYAALRVLRGAEGRSADR